MLRIGAASAEWLDQRPPKNVFGAIVSAMDSIGKVKEADEADGFVSVGS